MHAPARSAQEADGLLRWPVWFVLLSAWCKQGPHCKLRTLTEHVQLCKGLKSRSQNTSAKAWPRNVSKWSREANLTKPPRPQALSTMEWLAVSGKVKGVSWSVKVSKLTLAQKSAVYARCTRWIPSRWSQEIKSAWSSQRAGASPGPDSTESKSGPEKAGRASSSSFQREAMRNSWEGLPRHWWTCRTGSSFWSGVPRSKRLTAMLALCLLLPLLQTTQPWNEILKFGRGKRAAHSR